MGRLRALRAGALRGRAAGRGRARGPRGTTRRPRSRAPGTGPPPRRPARRRAAGRPRTPDQPLAEVSGGGRGRGGRGGGGGVATGPRADPRPGRRSGAAGRRVPGPPVPGPLAAPPGPGLPRLPHRRGCEVPLIQVRCPPPTARRARRAPPSRPRHRPPPARRPRGGPTRARERHRLARPAVDRQLAKEHMSKSGLALAKGQKTPRRWRTRGPARARTRSAGTERDARSPRRPRVPARRPTDAPPAPTAPAPRLHAPPPSPPTPLRPWQPSPRRLTAPPPPRRPPQARRSRRRRGCPSATACCGTSRAAVRVPPRLLRRGVQRRQSGRSHTQPRTPTRRPTDAPTARAAPVPASTPAVLPADTTPPIPVPVTGHHHRTPPHNRISA